MGATSCAAWFRGHRLETLQGLLGGLLGKQFPCGALRSGHGFGSRCMEQNGEIRVRYNVTASPT